MPLLFNPFASPTRFGHTSGLYHAFPPGLCIRDTRRLSDRHGRVILTGSFCLTLLDSPPLYGIGSTRQVGLCPSWLDIYAVTRMHIAILPYSIPSSKLNPYPPSSAFLVSVSSVSTHPCRHLQGFRGRHALSQFFWVLLFHCFLLGAIKYIGTFIEHWIVCICIIVVVVHGFSSY